MEKAVVAKRQRTGGSDGDNTATTLDHGNQEKHDDSNLHKAVISPALSLSRILLKDFHNNSTLDPILTSLCSFIAECICQRQPASPGTLEIEAKLGILKEKESSHYNNAAPQRASFYQDRLRLPVSSPCVLSAAGNSFFRFESDIPSSHHQHYNGFLNALVGSGSLKYERVKSRDVFMRDGSRKSLNPETGETLACIKKRRLGNWNLYCPNWPYDIRVSVAEEIPINVNSAADSASPSLDPGKPERIKNRMSYYQKKGSGISIDLTQVSQPQSQKLTHELELEMLDSHRLLQSYTVLTRGPHNNMHWSREFCEPIQEFWHVINGIVQNHSMKEA